MINQSTSMDERRTKHLGRLFRTIDFEFSETVNVDTIAKFKGDTPIGTFHIGGKEYQITLNEIRHIAETMERAENVFVQRYRFGSYGKR